MDFLSLGESRESFLVESAHISEHASFVNEFEFGFFYLVMDFWLAMTCFASIAHIHSKWAIEIIKYLIWMDFSKRWWKKWRVCLIHLIISNYLMISINLFFIFPIILIIAFYKLSLILIQPYFPLFWFITTFHHNVIVLILFRLRYLLYFCIPYFLDMRLILVCRETLILMKRKIAFWVESMIQWWVECSITFDINYV